MPSPYVHKTPLPDTRDRAESWAAFCASLSTRIEEIRRREGIDSSRGDAWQTFPRLLSGAWREGRP